MNTKHHITLLGLLACSILSAQIAVDFTAGEGYTDGPLANNLNWGVWDGSGSDPNTFTVDTAGSGTLVIDPTETAFQAAAYTGAGGNFTSNTYYGESTFTLDYTNGTTSIISNNAMVLPLFEIQNAGISGEIMTFGLRHVSANGSDGNRFNIFSLNKFDGANNGNFLPVFSGTDLGLEIDDSGNWTDGQSDTLNLTFSAVYEGSNQWTESVTLTNLDTSIEIASSTRTVTDTDDSFAANDNHLRIYASNAALLDVAIKMDSLSLAAVPEPSTYALLTGVCAFAFIGLRRRR